MSLIKFRFMERLASATASFGSLLAVNDRMDTILAKIQGLFAWRYSTVSISSVVSGGASSTADINIITTSIGAGYLQQGDIVRVVIDGTISKPLSIGTTINVWLKIGSTKVATLTWTPTATQTAQPFRCEFDAVVRTIAASGVVFGAGAGTWQMAAVTTTAISAGTTATVNTTAAISVTAGFNFSNSNASNNVVANFATIGLW